LYYIQTQWARASTNIWLVTVVKLKLDRQGLLALVLAYGKRGNQPMVGYRSQAGA